MPEGAESLWPAAARVWREPVVQWVLRGAAVVALTQIVPWLQSRASSGEVDKLKRRALAAEERLRAAEHARQQADGRAERIELRALCDRLDLIRFQAASAERRPDMRSETGAQAVRTYLDEIGVDDPGKRCPDRNAYSRALETKPPRPRAQR